MAARDSHGGVYVWDSDRGEFVHNITQPLIDRQFLTTFRRYVYSDGDEQIIWRDRHDIDMMVFTPDRQFVARLGLTRNEILINPQ